MKKNREWVISYILYLKNNGAANGHYIGNRTDGKRLNIQSALDEIKEKTAKGLTSPVDEVVITSIWENK